MKDNYAALVYINAIKKITDEIEKSLGTPSKVMESIEQLKMETDALRYHVWHMFHTSGKPST